MSWDLAALLIVRVWVLLSTGWGVLVMYRLWRRGTQLDFPIVPPPIVKLTGFFLAACFAVTLWITVGYFIDVEWGPNTPADVLSPVERTIYGSSLIYALSCTLWIINVGLKGYRHGPKVDSVVLDAIVQGMTESDRIDKPIEPLS